MTPEPESRPLVSPAAESATSGSAPAGGSARRGRGANMLPERDRRSRPERLLMRLVATCGIVAIGTALSAILISSGVHGWESGLIVSVVAVVLAALLWSSRIL